MPRITLYSSRDICFLCASTALVLVVLLIGACLAKVDADSIKQENTISVPDDRRGPALEQALRSMADSWREENRNR